jgi:DNA-binding response OmpR family regulator
VQPTGSILIIDREPTIAELLVEILTDAGYIVYTAMDGASGRVAITRLRPALILLDMGRLSSHGPVLMEELRVTDPARIPIVMMSTAPRDVVTLLGPGAAECLEKPFDLDELLACVSRYVQADTLPSQFTGTAARSAYLEQ